MVKKSLRQFTLMATATVTLLLGSVPLYAQTADVQQKLAELECLTIRSVTAPTSNVVRWRK